MNLQVKGVFSMDCRFIAAIVYKDPLPLFL